MLKIDQEILDPSIIHSMDGAIMRLIITSVYRKEKYIINHLHDSIQFHPNHYQSVLKSIVQVYTENDLGIYLEKSLLKNLFNNLIEEKKPAFDELLQDFKKNGFEEIVVTPENFNVEGMFPWE